MHRGFLCQAPPPPCCPTSLCQEGADLASRPLVAAHPRVLLSRCCCCLCRAMSRSPTWRCSASSTAASCTGAWDPWGQAGRYGEGGWLAGSGAWGEALQRRAGGRLGTAAASRAGAPGASLGSLADLPRYSAAQHHHRPPKDVPLLVLPPVMCCALPSSRLMLWPAGWWALRLRRPSSSGLCSSSG